MSSLQSMTASSSFGSSLGLRQKFTPNYLAKQLPVFQERVPRVAQESLKFPTDAPPNLPLPPLLPGEEILLQQHRVACLESFAEPAVGSIYITNFRIIFNGNSISDPESRESILEGLPTKKESYAFTLDTGKLPKFRGSRPSATFNSYLTNPDQVPSKPGRHSKWQDLKRNSLKRPNRSSSENNVTSAIAIKKSSSLKHGPQNDNSIDGFGSVWSEIGSVFNRGTRSLRIPGKRKGMIQKESIRWDSVSSVSSLSEELEQNISPTPPEEPTFTVGSIDTTISGVSVNGGVGGIFPEVLSPETQTSSPNTEDSGVITDHLSGSWTAASGNSGQNGGMLGGTGNGDEVDFEKYSSSTAALDPILETEAQRLDLDSSMDPSLLMDPSLEQRRQEETRRSWFHRSNSPSAPEEDSASDEDSGEDEKSRTLTQDPSGDNVAPVGYSKVQIIALKAGPERSTSPVYSTPVKVTGHSKHSGQLRETSQEASSMKESRSAGNGGDKQVSPPLRKKPLPPTPPKKPHSLSSSGNTGSTGGGRTAKVLLKNQKDKESGPENEGGVENGCEEQGEEETIGGYANFAVFKRLDEKRERSISNPWPLKKPVPLPRNKSETLDRMDSTGRGFGCSLPADFKPTPVPRRPTLVSPPSSSSNSPKLPRSSHSRPPISPKPTFSHLPKPSPPLPRAHPPSTSSQNTSDPPCSVSDTSPNSPDSGDPVTSPTANCKASSDQTEDFGNGVKQLNEQPVAPPRQKRKTKTTHTRPQPLSPIYSPTQGSPVKTAAVSSDTGSSDQPDTSSESDISHPRHKFLPSPSPVPRSPSPNFEALPLGWQEELSHSSSVMAQCHSIPSIRSSFTASPLDLPSAYGYMGDREPLPPAFPYNTLTRHHPARSLSPLPTSTRYSFSSSLTLFSIHSIKKQPALLLKDDGMRLPEGIVVRARNFRYMKLHIHPHNRYDADGLKELLEKKILVEMPPQELFAFHYCAAIRHPNPNFLHTTALPNFFKLQDEMDRLKLSGSQVWHVTSVLKNNPDVSPSYPRKVIVPLCIPDLDLLRGAKLYRHGRFPTLSWSSQDGSVFLLRAAPTVTHRGQSGRSGMCLDEAILQAVCVFTEKAQGGTKLYIFTEKPESTTGALSDPMHTSLTEAQKRAYYYHNCQFEYVVNPPTYKNVRHSFNKLSAVLEESKVGEDEFLIALDDTHWLYRIHELLQTASAVVGKLEEESASVLVSYDCGWDRTAQITSLAQLLLDPYYRTMDGFQVLVQKEWLWFGHPFQSRHTRRGRVKEDGPVFLQWVDCVWQVMQQCPSAFEFNEKFLMVLVESSYSGQFGTFLLNNEQERQETFSDEAHKHKSVLTHTLSFWTWVSMVNAAGKTFYNYLYDPKTFPWVIYPNCRVPCLKLWTNHYSQSKYQEHHSTTTTTSLQKQLDQLVRVYQKLYSQVDQPLSANTAALSVSPSPSTFSDDSSRNTPNLERGRERVRQSGCTVRSKTPVLYHTIKQYLTTQGIDSSVCKHAEIAGCTCQGSLVKLGGVRKNWQERWFVLDFASQLLTYFENREAYTEADRGTPKGVIELNDIDKVWQNTKKKDHLVRHIFTVETKNRSYLFRAPSLITMELWMAVLNMPRSALQVDS